MDDVNCWTAATISAVDLPASPLLFGGAGAPAAAAGCAPVAGFGGGAGFGGVAILAGNGGFGTPRGLLNRASAAESLRSRSRKLCGGRSSSSRPAMIGFKENSEGDTVGCRGFPYHRKQTKTSQRWARAASLQCAPRVRDLAVPQTVSNTGPGRLIAGCLLSFAAACLPSMLLLFSRQHVVLMSLITIRSNTLSCRFLQIVQRHVRMASKLKSVVKTPNLDVKHNPVGPAPQQEADLYQCKRWKVVRFMAYGSIVQLLFWGSTAEYTFRMYQQTGHSQPFLFTLGAVGIGALFSGAIYVYGRHFVKRLELTSDESREAMLRIVTPGFLRGERERLVRIPDIERVLANTKLERTLPESVTLRLRGERTWY
jgi:hypothetical protein